MNWQLAQLNIARMKAPLEDPIMQDFSSGLEAMNQLAEHSDGFVWRLQGESGDGTPLSSFEDPLILVNLSVWRDVEALQNYAYKSEHRHFIKSRRSWFEDLGMAHQVLWWVPEGILPSVLEAKTRLTLLQNEGVSHWGFNFKGRFAMPQLGAGVSRDAIARHAELLGRSGLNPEDFSQLSPEDFIHAQHGGLLAAGVAVQNFEEHGLLRSLVVADSLRGAGLARDLVSLAIDRARQQGKKSLYLLTETAAPYFKRFGFECVSRQSAPAAIANSAQFSRLCPAGSDCLMLEL